MKKWRNGETNKREMMCDGRQHFSLLSLRIFHFHVMLDVHAQLDSLSLTTKARRLERVFAHFAFLHFCVLVGSREAGVGRSSP